VAISGSTATVTTSSTTGITVAEVDGSPSSSGITRLVLPNGTVAISGSTATYTAAAPATPTITVEEIDGAPTGSITKLVLPNGSVAISGSTATYTAGSAGITVAEVDGSPSSSGITTLVLPNGTVAISGSTATYTAAASDAILGQSGIGGARISGLQGSPDIDVAGTNDDEFNTTTANGSTPVGWSITANTPTTLDVNTTRKSALYVKYTNAVGVDRVAGLIKAAPSIPYTVTAKISDATLKASNYAGAFIGLSDNSVGNGKGTVWMTLWNQGSVSARQLNLSTYTTLIPGGGGSASGGGNPFSLNAVAFPPCYLRIVVTAAGNIDYQFSQGGDIWYSGVSASAFLSAATYVLLGAWSIGATAEATFDWIRFT
jgi:hypothetical protein